MTRRAHRDPVSLRVLRRMAYQVNRPGVRAVLHDALLERFPEYGGLIDFAEKLAREDRRPYIIMFDPQALKKGSDSCGNVYAAHRFAVFSGSRGYERAPWSRAFLHELRSPPSSYKDHVLVYIAGLKRKS